jgi:hypothetical protein
MKHRTLAAYGSLIVAACAFGVHLGQSAISQINPIHFQGAAVHPRDRGAAVPELLESQAVAFSDHYGWEEGQAARTAEGFTAVAETPRAQPAFAVAETGWRADPEPAASYRQTPQEAETADAEAAAPMWAEVDRYATYPLQSNEEPAPAAEVELALLPE